MKPGGVVERPAGQVAAYDQRRGAWGETYATRKRYGYPPPRRSPLEAYVDALEARIARLEALVGERLP